MSDAEFIQHFEENVEGLEPGNVTMETELSSIPQWDSLAVLTVLAMADAEYGVTLTGNDLADCKTVGDIHSLVQQKKGG